MNHVSDGWGRSVLKRVFTPETSASRVHGSHSEHIRDPFGGSVVRFQL